ncbi:copper-binding protein [Desulfobotulus sp.]|jgi:Cu(I)/Ag(I) efflux system protein CusF|uniref:copper-binding protein n=1 Tax=Desulfobotulus sp. TaxID=1940337 RepID=UPI002A3600EA|nr:copper-binding protein [Desulfobotulus sp.]MDY0164157.1 copper-binding protein [Desulfobotulus sp.]
MKKMILILALIFPFVFCTAPMASSHSHGDHHGAAEAREGKVVTGMGLVTALNPAAKSITLKHEPIRELNWPAMTMALALESPDLAKGLKVGDKVAFKLKQLSATEYVITEITKH